MSLLVVGSIALDSVKTPFGEARETLGGSATYFSASASFFSRVQLVGVVGEDFPHGELGFLEARGVDLAGLEKVAGKTFRWEGKYEYDLNEAHTLSTCLNVFEGFRPRLPEDYRKAECVFLANIDPELQQEVLEQVECARVVGCDTMNFWIKGKNPELLETLEDVDVLFLNDGEARELAREPNLIKAARIIRALGPKILVIKKGEHGALLFSPEGFFSVPAYPLEEVYDPTGAGDSFAGGFMGHVAQQGELSDQTIRRAMVYGSVMASFCVEKFSVERLKTLTREEINGRFRAFKRMCHFEELET